MLLRCGARTRRIPLPLTGVRIVTQLTITSTPPSTARRSKSFFVRQAGLEIWAITRLQGNFRCCEASAHVQKNEPIPSSFARGKCWTNNVQSLTLHPDAYQEINLFFLNRGFPSKLWRLHDVYVFSRSHRGTLPCPPPADGLVQGSRPSPQPQSTSSLLIFFSPTLLPMLDLCFLYALRADEGRWSGRSGDSRPASDASTRLYSCPFHPPGQRWWHFPCGGAARRSPCRVGLSPSYRARISND